MKEKEYKCALPKGTILRSPKRDYAIESVLGQGGFGITYKVSSKIKIDNVTIRTFFAIKEFFMSDSCERNHGDFVCYSTPVKEKVEEGRNDFLAEAKRLNKISLNHLNIVHVNEVFESNNTVYYVMEYLDGGSLRDYVRKNGVLSEQKALDMMLPIFHAVEVLHQNHMTHLDIKPDNIMLKYDVDSEMLVPVLIDFGLAKHYDTEGHPTSTVRNLGFSDGYSPVEQYVGIYSFSPQSDVYSLAATLLYLLVGKDPVVASEQNEEKILASLSMPVSLPTKEAIVEAMRLRKADRTTDVTSLISQIEAVDTKKEKYDLGINMITFLPDEYGFEDVAIYYRGKCCYEDIDFFNDLADNHDFVSAVNRITSNKIDSQKTSLHFSDYVQTISGNIAFGFSIVSYRTIDDYLLVKNVIEDNGWTGCCRIIREMDLWALCHHLEEDKSYCLKGSEGFCLLEFGGGIFDIIETGLQADDLKTDIEYTEVEIDSFYSHFVVGSMALYEIVQKKLDTLLLNSFPFSVEIFVWENHKVRKVELLLKKNTSIPFKKESEVIDCCDTTIEFRMERYCCVLDINGIFGISPSAVSLALDMHQNGLPYLIIHNIESGEKKKISLPKMKKICKESLLEGIEEKQMETDGSKTDKIKAKKKLKWKFLNLFGKNKC